MFRALAPPEGERAVGEQLERKQGQLPGQDPSSERVGPYELKLELARGAFATVHLAQKQGAMGFHRLFAVKRLKAPYTRQPEHVELLLDEARIASGVHHPNVVSVHDVGTGQNPFVAMEYVDGENLETLLARAGQERHPRYIVPLVVDVLAGLAAVHHEKGDDGLPLGLVHQAPSAHHVMVGSDGTARLIDFGQAKGRSVAPSHLRSDRLRMAAMAPEQALDPSTVDARADLFIVGVMLWEALTGQALFASDSEATTFQNLLHKPIARPSEVGLMPPRCFDGIILRALERDPLQRYLTAGDFMRDLREVAIHQALFATPGELGQWVTALAGPQLATRRRLVGQGTAQEEPSGSGLFASKSQPENPYGSGLIYGSARPAFGSEGDPDKTPAFGVRPPQVTTESARPVRVMEVDARRGKDERTSFPSPEPGAVPLPVEARPRSSEQTVETPAVEAPHERFERVTRADKPEAQKPARTRAEILETLEANLPHQAYDDNENTLPGGFVPTKPGARRTPGQNSPGAYSDVKARTSSKKNPLDNIFDDVDTSRMELLNRRGSSVPPEGLEARRVRELAVTERADASTAKPPPLAGQKVLKPKSDPARLRPAMEGPTQHGGRRDSLPVRMTLPEGPVGLPMGLSEPKGPAGTAHPEEVTALDRLALRQTLGDAILLPVDSLSPPTAPARTAPPRQRSEYARPRGVGFWITAGMLLGFMAVASFVGVRSWRADQHAASQGVVEIPATAVEAPEAAPPKPAPSAQPAPVAPGTVAQPVAPAEATKLPEVVLGAEPTTTAPAVRPPKARKKPVKPGTEGAATVPAGATTQVEPEVAPVSAEIRERAPPARKQLIPENPY